MIREPVSGYLVAGVSLGVLALVAMTVFVIRKTPLTWTPTGRMDAERTGGLMHAIFRVAASPRPGPRLLPRPRVAVLLPFLLFFFSCGLPDERPDAARP